MALPPTFTASFKQLVPVFICMIILVLLVTLTGCQAGSGNYQAVSNSADAFMRNCDFPSMQYAVAQQGDTQVFTVTCKKVHDDVH